MYKKKKWRFYCDFCKKGGGSSYHMKNHESHCTKNPKRICRMCGIDGSDGKWVNEIKAALGNGGQTGIKQLRDVCDNCPACILTAIRQVTNDHEYGFDPDGGFDYDFEFDFKKESECLFKERSEENKRQIGMSEYGY